jgi:hypothetical protein
MWGLQSHQVASREPGCDLALFMWPRRIKSLTKPAFTVTIFAMMMGQRFLAGGLTGNAEVAVLKGALVVVARVRVTAAACLAGSGPLGLRRICRN